jgi:hypothetical protein
MVHSGTYGLNLLERTSAFRSQHKQYPIEVRLLAIRYEDRFLTFSRPDKSAFPSSRVSGFAEFLAVGSDETIEPLPELFSGEFWCALSFFRSQFRRLPCALTR